MKILKFIQNAEYKQLGIENKVLHIKVGEMPMSMRLGTLKEIKSMEKKDSVTVNGKTVQMAQLTKALLGDITEEGLQLAESYTDEEFYNDFLQDFKQMSREPGEFIFIGEADEWD